MARGVERLSTGQAGKLNRPSSDLGFCACAIGTESVKLGQLNTRYAILFTPNHAFANETRWIKIPLYKPGLHKYNKNYSYSGFKP